MKVYDAASIRNVAVVGHGGSGKTQLVSAAAVRRRDGQPPWQGGRRQHSHRLRRRRNRPQTYALGQPRLRRVEQDQNQPDRHARLRQLLLRCPRRDARGRRARWWWSTAWPASRCRPRRRGPPPTSSGCRAWCWSTASIAIASSLERTLESVRQAWGARSMPIQLPIGEEKNFSGVVDLVAMKAYTFAGDGSGKMTEGASARRAWPTPPQAAREALIEMVAEADETLMEKFFEAGTLTQDELVRGLAGGDARGQDRSRWCARRGCRTSACSRCIDAVLAYLPSPADRPFTALADKRDRSRKTADEKAPYAAFVWKTVADQFAGPHHDVPRLPGRAEGRFDGHQRHAGHAGAARPPDRDAGQDRHQRAGAQGRRPRRGRQAEGHAHQRHPRRQGRRHHVRADRVSRAGAVVRHRAEEPRRRRQDQHRDAPARGGRRHHQVPARSADPRAAARRPGPDAHRGHGGEAQAALRRRSAAQTAAHPVPRDHHLAGRGARPPQETDRRPRPVRRLQDPDGAAAARQRVRVRRRDLRRLDPARSSFPAVEKGIQESRLRGYLAGYPVVDFRVVLYDGSYHDVDSNELSFKTAGWLAFKDGMSKAPSRRCSSRS